MQLLIKKIPLGAPSSQGQLVWHYSKSGVFSVKSAYHLILDQNLLSNASIKKGKSSAANRNWWKWIWQLQVPNKPKIFVWGSARMLYLRVITYTNGAWSPVDIIEFSRLYVPNFVDIIYRQMLDNGLLWLPVSSIKWRSLSMSWIKLNFDGACFKEEGAVGLGAIARNNDRHFLVGDSRNIISALEHGGSELSMIRNIMLEARSIAAGLPDVKFSWVSR
ncbi:hypothetical protein LguiB_009579 [Lonicera macranthoides]